MQKIGQVKKLDVKTTAKLAGLSAHTLRAWENRHSVVKPSRSDSGRRLYTSEDIQKLKLLRVLSESGHAIGQLCLKSRSELEGMVKCPEKPNPLLSKTLKVLLKAVDEFNFELLDRTILGARIELAVRVFVLELVGPLVREVGNLVHQQKLTIAQEHVISALLRNHLGELLSQVQKTSATTGQKLPKLLFSTPEGDHHEFGILSAAILSGAHGFQFRYLGPNMPPRSLADASRKIDADVIVIGIVEADEKRLAQSLRHFMRELTEQLGSNAFGRGSNISIWIGGQCDRFSKKIVGESICYLDSLIDFENKLKEVKNEK